METMKFTIIIATRNRPKLLGHAIQSVMAQSFTDFEIIVVNDGSNSEYQDAYQALEKNTDNKVSFINLRTSLNGHGPSYSRNIGALHAQGNYLCFLDDDDTWIDQAHLRLAHDTLKKTQADVYFSNQKVYEHQELTDKKIWLAPLDKLINKNTKQAINGAYSVTIDELLQVDGFCHLNTTTVSKPLFQTINGFNENIRYEEDRLFYYTLLDKAEKIFYNPTETARHNVPDKIKNDSASSSTKTIEKYLYQLALLDKSILSLKKAKIIKTLKRHKTYTLKAISRELYQEKKYGLARHYALQVLFNDFTLKWLGFSLLLIIKSATSINKHYKPHNN